MADGSALCFDSREFSGMLLMRSTDLIKHIPVVLIAVLLCGLAPMAMADTAPDGDEYIFYPSPPNEPRLQFLTKFSSALDVSAKKKGFRDFVFGGQENEAQLIFGSTTNGL